MTGLIAVLTLMGCAGEGSPAGTSPATDTEAATETATASSSPEPADSTTATCENVLTDADYADLAASGLIPVESGPAAEFLPEVFSGRSLVLCTWAAPESDIGFVYARTAMTAGEWTEQQVTLAGEGFRAESDPRGELFVGAENDLGAVTAVLYRDGVLHYTSNLPEFDRVAALQ